MTAVVNSKRYPREWGEVQGLEGLRAVDPVVSIQRCPCCSLELPSTWSGAVAPVGEAQSGDEGQALPASWDRRS